MLDIIIALCALIFLLCLTQIALTRRAVSRERSKGYDRSTLRLQQEQAKELARIVELQKDRKISAADAATANRLIAEQMALQTAELDEQRNNSYAAVQQDLIIRRLELGQDEIGLIRFKDRIENEALRKRLERELGLGEQQRINSLVWRDMKLREETLQKKLDDTRLAAQKEMLELFDQEREKRLAMFAEWQEQALAQAGDPIGSDIAIRGSILGDLQERFGSIGELDFPAITEQIAALGIAVGDVGNAFGFTATNFNAFKLQVESLAKFKDGDVMGGIIDGLKAITTEALFSQQAFISFGQAAGNAILGLLNGTETAGSALKKFFFGLLGDLAIQFGSFLIAVGAGMAAVSVLFGFSGGAAIAAGIVLIALGTVLKGLAGGSGAAQGGATATSEAPGGSNVADIGPARERRLRRQEFNTSGESRERRPLEFIPGVGGRESLRVEIDLNLNGGDDVATALIAKHEIVTVSGLSRGKVRTKVRKRVA